MCVLAVIRLFCKDESEIICFCWFDSTKCEIEGVGGAVGPNISGNSRFEDELLDSVNALYHKRDDLVGL